MKYTFQLCALRIKKKRSTLFEYLNKEYRISVQNKPVQKLIAKYLFDCYEKRRSSVDVRRTV